MFKVACTIIGMTVLCPTGTKNIKLSSSVYDFSRASCSITKGEVITCANTLVIGTNVHVTVVIDMKKMTSTVR